MITYRGQKFAGYNKPKSTPGAPKKSAVLAKEGGQVKLVRFGDPNMTIKKHIPKNRKSFRARHGCDTPGTKLSAKFWSCAAWGLAMIGSGAIIAACNLLNQASQS
jgi:hypothetical protein